MSEIAIGKVEIAVAGLQVEPESVRASAALLSDAERQREDVAAYAFAPGREIGIDVEAVRELRGADDIAAHFFSRLENEAYFGHRLDRFDVSMAPDQPAKILRVENTPGEDCGWRMESFRPGPGFIAAVVTEAP